LIDLGRYVKELIPFMVGINGRIDQTMLKYDKGLKDYEKFVETSEPYSFRSLVVPSIMVPYVASISKTPVAGVAGFPYGYMPLKSKLDEIDFVASSGGKEVDVVVNIINIKTHDYQAFKKEVESIVRRAKDLGLVVKIIVETSALTDEELIEVSKIVSALRADFIKTNSGYGSRGVNMRDVYLIRSVVEGDIRIKVAGGIRTAIDAATFLKAGADIIGASSGIKIADEAAQYLMKA